MSTSKKRLVSQLGPFEKPWIILMVNPFWGHQYANTICQPPLTSIMSNDIYHAIWTTTSNCSPFMWLSMFGNDWRGLYSQGRWIIWSFIPRKGPWVLELLGAIDLGTTGVGGTNWKNKMGVMGGGLGGTQGHAL